MYDENDALEFMRSHLNPEFAGKYDDDELLNVIDMIWDYYEANGMLEIDDDDDDEEERDELVDSIVEYASRMVKRDKEANMAVEDLRPIVEAELAYEDSLL